MDASPHISTDFARPTMVPDGAPAQPLPGERCALCGNRLHDSHLRYSLVSPWVPEQRLDVCHTCRKASLGEGYRPAA